ncbi:hypothetical protein N7492_007819 [Penicillium capsulatum]|uniref:Polynucleotide adenylyltransferase n=1 Tax=Penicillium capsulatum TaxID=69766 RepID=A0A9W9I0I2_9EURO|nr:hypothetical protein N7492_007819 [Penicillium capsulatum]KAJ6117650.1 hypothetical protein N7512_007375 [Penicillium capsulatum]
MRLTGIQPSRLSVVPRRSRSVIPPSQDRDVFANSLEKTLAAHRSSNRARLIRKTYPRAPAAGLIRLEVPPENRPGYQPPQVSPSTLEKSVPKPSVARRRWRKQDSSNPSSPETRSTANGFPRDSKKLSDLRPWLSHLVAPDATGDAIVYLDAEIRALDDYLRPSSLQTNQVAQIGAEIASLLHQVSDAPRLFGSRRTGLAVAHSAVDFILPFQDRARSLSRARMPSATRPQAREAHGTFLRQAHALLRHSQAFGDHVHLNTKSQVLEGRHIPTGLPLRLSCAESVPAMTEYLQDCLVEYPTLRPLYVATRALLEARGLYGPAPGNIRSDALAMLVVAFLRMNHGRFPGPNRLGDQFLALLRLYGQDIDIQTIGVAVDPAGFFDAEVLLAPSDTVSTPAYLRGQRSLMRKKRTAAEKCNTSLSRGLCVQDPTHYLRNLGLSCTRAAELQRTFSDAYDLLRRTCDTWEGQRGSDSIFAAALRNRRPFSVSTN